MKVRHILINLLAFPICICYFLLTSETRDLLMSPTDGIVWLIFSIASTVYNLSAKDTILFLVRNCISSVSLTLGTFICGQIYLNYFPHMSDEHFAVYTVPFDFAIEALFITAAACAVSYARHEKRTEQNGRRLLLSVLGLLACLVFGVYLFIARETRFFSW